MRRKLALLFILFIVSVFLPPSLRSVSAQRINNQGGISIPVSGPIFPISNNVISGQVSYRVFGVIIPAPFVKVDITDLRYPGSWYTYTDIIGRYIFYLSDGAYKLKVSDHSNTVFIPVDRIVRVQNQQYFNLDFRGIKKIFGLPPGNG